jgi:hypothetical protein
MSKAVVSSFPSRTIAEVKPWRPAPLIWSPGKARARQILPSRLNQTAAFNVFSRPQIKRRSCGQAVCWPASPTTYGSNQSPRQRSLRRPPGPSQPRRGR